jgi:TonB family protein
MLAGIFRPMVLLPADIAVWADPEEQRAIVFHEVAHFERRDHLVNVFQTVIGAILFFHPAIRYALRQLALERELACDEHVLGAGAHPDAYAEALLKVAERAVAGRQSYQPAFNASGKILDMRVTMILNYRPSSLYGSRLAQVVRTAVVCGVAFLLLPERIAVPESPLSLPVLVAAVPEMSFSQETTPPAPSTAMVAQAVVPGVLPGQVQTGSVSGTVFDRSGAVVPGVTVRLASPVDGSTQTTVTNERGAYAFPRVNVGQYNFEARLPGFVIHSRAMFVQTTPAVHDVVLYLAFATVVEVSVAAPQASPAPVAAAAPSQTPIRVGGVIAAPELINQLKPVYPPGAYAKRAQDSVQLDAVIGTDGTVKSLLMNPSQGGSNLELIQAAMDAVKQWRYRPALLNGAPIEIPITITVNFTMQ